MGHFTYWRYSGPVSANFSTRSSPIGDFCSVRSSLGISVGSRNLRVGTGCSFSPASGCETIPRLLTQQTSKAIHVQGNETANQHSTVTHYQRPNMTHPQEGGTGGEVSEILFFSAKSKRRPSLIYSMQIIPVCLSIVARRKGVSATRRRGLNWTPISLLVGHPCKLFHTTTDKATVRAKQPSGQIPLDLSTERGRGHGVQDC